MTQEMKHPPEFTLFILDGLFVRSAVLLAVEFAKIQIPGEDYVSIMLRHRLIFIFAGSLCLEAKGIKVEIL